MRNYNIILIYNNEMNNFLMCKRKENPYKGLINLVGGKIEDDEDKFTAAYRELFEETGITTDDIKLHHLMDFNYIYVQVNLEVYVGKLNKEVKLVTEVNQLLWMDVNENYFDMSIYAGEGNIGHIVEHVKQAKGIFI